MRPVAIFRFAPGDEPGHFADWLDAAGRPRRLFALHDGEPVPSTAAPFAGIGMMGGPMSVNDPLPWVAPMQSLLRDAIARDVPVIGHCLGGQLLATALGARVRRAATAEIGWTGVETCDAAAAGEWFGGRARFAMFQWHYETFDLPDGARRVLASAWTANQAYVVGDRHLGMQGHVEITAAIARSWVAQSGGELPRASTPSMQCATDLLRDLEARVAASNAVADDIYARWARGLAR
jgi:GMP synthase-like glutamine amidotransferase